MTNKIKKAATAQAATPDVSQQTEDSVTPVTSNTFVTRYADAKKRLTDLQCQRDDPFKDVKEGEAVDFNTLYEQTDPNPTISAVINEVLAAIAPDGCEIRQAGNGDWYVISKDKFIIVTPEEQKAKRSASAKKAADTKAKNNWRRRR